MAWWTLFWRSKDETWRNLGKLPAATQLSFLCGYVEGLTRSIERLQERVEDLERRRDVLAPQAPFEWDTKR